jgi:hypothetical protein
MNFKRRVLYFLREFGFDPLKFVQASLNSLHFIKTLFVFSRKTKISLRKLSPTLNDFNASAGSARGHYFWQDLICARWIKGNNPSNHLDLGSRIDGFIAHLLTFMPVEVLDIRALETRIPGLTSRVVDAQSGLAEYSKKYQSVSSLHSIEHFGLGRYRDPLDIDGHTKGLIALSGCVAPGGYLFISFPIGAPSIEFNSQRILHPEWPMPMLPDFELIEFVLIPWSEEPIYGIKPNAVDLSISGQCGLYKFKKKSI